MLSSLGLVRQVRLGCPVFGHGHTHLQASRKVVVNDKVRQPDKIFINQILVDAETKHILGAAILGIGGDEVVQILLDVMYAKAPHTAVQRAMHIHPTVAEILPTLMSNLKPIP